MAAAQLLSPAKIGSLILKNRVVLAPLTRARAGPSRLPNDLMKTYYEQRSGAGLLIAEAVGISPQGYGWNGAPALYTEEQALAWKPIVQAVQAKGAKFFVQLWHMGRQSHPSLNPANEVVAPSALRLGGDAMTRNANGEKVFFELPRALETTEIAEVVQSYQESARLAKLAGFDGIEIHSANGYLLDTFLQSATNKRTDKYGGNFENRYRILKEVVSAVGEVYPFDRVGVRLSPNGAYGGMGSEDNAQMFPYVAKQLSTFGLAYLHVMDGLGFGFHDKCNVVTLYDMKKEFNGPIMGNVGFTKESADGAIRSGAADLIAFGRLFMSNPDLVERFANNWRLEDIPPHEYWWYGGGAKGYTDYLPYQEATATVSSPLSV